jgi:hypothetical protein
LTVSSADDLNGERTHGWKANANHDQQSGPQCFMDELDLLYHSMKIYNLRDHLGRYPVDLVRYWWRNENHLPGPTSLLAHGRYRAGAPPCRKLYKGPPHFVKPSLRVIDGGKNVPTDPATSDKVDLN